MQFTKQNYDSLVHELGMLAEKHRFGVLFGHSPWQIDIVDNERPIIVPVCQPARGAQPPFIRSADESVAELDRVRDWYAKDMS